VLQPFYAGVLGGHTVYLQVWIMENILKDAWLGHAHCMGVGDVEYEGASTWAHSSAFKPGDTMPGYCKI